MFAAANPNPQEGGTLALTLAGRVFTWITDPDEPSGTGRPGAQVADRG